MAGSTQSREMGSRSPLWSNQTFYFANVITKNRWKEITGDSASSQTLCRGRLAPRAPRDWKVEVVSPWACIVVLGYMHGRDIVAELGNGLVDLLWKSLGS